MSGWFGKAKQRLAMGDAAWDTSTYYVVVITESGHTTNYTYDRTHASMADVPAGARQGTPTQLTGKTVNADGELLCNNFSITGLTSGLPASQAIMVYEQVSASDANRYPLLYKNGLTIIPNDGDYNFTVQASSPYLGRF